MYYSGESYGLAGFLVHQNDGVHCYRDDEAGFAQPLTLRPGDLLATDTPEGFTEVIKCFPKLGQSCMSMMLADGETITANIRTPLQLENARPITMPRSLQIGNILVTGEVVLDKPLNIDNFVWLMLKNGRASSLVKVPATIGIATLLELYPPDPTSLIGAFTIHETLKMQRKFRANLPNAGVVS